MADKRYHSSIIATPQRSDWQVVVARLAWQYHQWLRPAQNIQIRLRLHANNTPDIFISRDETDRVASNPRTVIDVTYYVMHRILNTTR